jgi:hypothetical protein
MTHKLKYLLIIFVLCTPLRKVYSQDKTNVTKPCYWLYGGVGAGRPGDFLHGGLGVSTEFGNFMISARAALAGSFDRPENINDIGVLFGISKKSRYFRVSFSGGLGYVHGSEFTDGTTGSTIGIPLEIQAFTTAAHFFGVGVCGNANINLKSSFFSILLYAQMGKLR